MYTLSENHTAGGISLSDLKIYKGIIAKIITCYWHESRNIDQWNIMEDPEKDSCVYSLLIQQQFQEYTLGKEWSL